MWLGAARHRLIYEFQLRVEIYPVHLVGWGILVVPIVVGAAIIVGALAQLSLQALRHFELAFLAFNLGLFAAAALN